MEKEIQNLEFKIRLRNLDKARFGFSSKPKGIKRKSDKYYRGLKSGVKEEAG
jgi:hypothetical protein